MHKVCSLSLAGAVLAGLAPFAAAAADIDHGRELFVACVACHTERPDALGPSLRGVVGRRAGALEDFRYSNPMKRANFIWDEANLRECIANPQAKVKGNRMPNGGVRDSKDIDDVIAYLVTLK